MMNSSLSNATDQHSAQEEFTSRFYDLLAVLAFLICVSGFFGNFTIANVIWKHKKMHTPTNWLVFNLAICNLLIVTVIMPYNLILPLIDWPFGEIGCRYLVMPVMEHLASVCVLTYTAISIARYAAICNVGNKGGIDSKMAAFIIALIWSISFVVVSASLMGLLGQFNVIHIKDRSHCKLIWKSVKSRRIYRMSVFILSCVFPMVTSGYSCCRIYYIVSRSLKKIIFILPADMILLRQKKSRQIGFRLLIIYIVMAITISPLQLYLVMRDFNLIPTFRATHFILQLLKVIFYMQSTTTPLLLLYMGDEYRKEIFRMSACCCIGFPRMREPLTIVKGYIKELCQKHKMLSESRSESYSVEQWVVDGRYVTTIIPTTHDDDPRSRSHTECTDVSLISYHGIPHDVFRRSRSHTECTDVSLDDSHKDSKEEGSRVRVRSENTEILLDDNREDFHTEMLRASNCRKRSSIPNKENDNNNNSERGKRNSLTNIFSHLSRPTSTIQSKFLAQIDQSTQTESISSMTEEDDMTSINMESVESQETKELCYESAIKSNHDREGVIWDEDDWQFRYFMNLLGDLGRETYI